MTNQTSILINGTDHHPTDPNEPNPILINPPPPTGIENILNAAKCLDKQQECETIKQKIARYARENHFQNPFYSANVVMCSTPNCGKPNGHLGLCCGEQKGLGRRRNH
jgi:hypothetical protein